jgi:DNA gyrase subunit A
VREHEDLVFISQNGIVQRTGVRGINRYGRASQGVRVMKLREGDEVSAVALVVESEADVNGDAEVPATADGDVAETPET